MHTEFLMGNEAIALGALAAGVNVVCGYPGTPSSEVLETVAKRKTEHTYVEWSVNEKAAMERIAAQMPQAEKIERATEVIENEKTEEKLCNELTRLYESTRRRVERENA